MPPQLATPQSHNPDNIHSHTESQNKPQSSPTTQSRQQSPIRTNTNLPTQPFIQAAETHKSMSSSPLQHIPKYVNGEGVKSSKQENRSSDQMDDSAFTVNNQATSRRIAQSNHTVPNAGQEDTYQQNALLNNRATGQLMTDANFKRK